MRTLLFAAAVCRSAALSTTTTRRDKSSEIAKRVSRLLLDPVGRGRDKARAKPYGASRYNEDPMMFTHAAFVPGLIVAASRGLFDLAGLQTTLLALSLAYHRDFERPGRLARLEGTVAKAFFVYGVAQILYCPSDIDGMVYVAEIGCSLLTVGTFLFTNLWPETYDTYHPVGLHVIPGLWSLLVAFNHVPLVDLASGMSL